LTTGELGIVAELDTTTKRRLSATSEDQDADDNKRKGFGIWEHSYTDEQAR